MRWALPLVVLGAAVRFYFVGTSEMGDDERFRYVEIARNLRDGEGFSIAGRPTAQSMPLWPAVLSLFPAPERARWLAGILSTLALPVAWLVGRRLAGPRVALLALALLAVDLEQARLGGSLLTEPLFTLLLCLFALAWVNDRLLPFALALFGREWRRPLVLLAVIAVAVAPWAHRNQRVFGAFVPFTTTSGIAFHSGMNPQELELPFRKRGQGRAVKYKHARELAGQGIEVTYDREKREEALAFVRERPGSAAFLTFGKLVQIWTPLQRKGTAAVYALAIVAAWWALWRRVRFSPALIGPMLLVMTVVGVVFLALPRYRAPYHPYLFILAASVPWRLRDRAAA